jgi:hypothetical protein
VSTDFARLFRVEVIGVKMLTFSNGTAPAAACVIPGVPGAFLYQKEQPMRRIVAAGIVAVLMGMTPVLAQADITFTLGNTPQPDEENVLLNSGAVGNPVFGKTQQSDITVQFSSTTDTLVEPSSGQARVEAQDGSLNNISVSVPGGTYIDLIINPFFGSGDAKVTVVADDGTATFTYALSNGQNFLTIVATNGEKILSTTIDAPGGFTDLRQPRISGAALSERVPEPGVAMLLGAGLGVVALYRGRKSR